MVSESLRRAWKKFRNQWDGCRLFKLDLMSVNCFRGRFVTRTPNQLQKIRRVARAPKTEALDQNLDRLSPDLPKSLNEGIYLKSY